MFRPEKVSPLAMTAARAAKIGGALVSLISCLLVGAGLAKAQSQGSFLDPSVGGALYFGSTGVGGQGNVALNENISLFGGLDTWQFDVDLNATDGVPLVDGARLKASSFLPYAMAGYHPFGNGIRFGGGLAYADLNIDGEVTYDGAVEGLSYKGKVAVEIDNQNRIAPVLTAGFVQSSQGGIGFYSEIGAVFSGGLTPSVSAEQTCGANTVCETERANAVNQVTNVVNDAVELYPGFYPIVRFGLQISF